MRWMLRMVGSTALIALLFVVLPAESILAALSGLSPALFSLCVIGFLLAHVFGIVKWRLMLCTAGCPLSWRFVGRCYLLGLFGNVFLPSLVGGDLVSVALALQRTSNRTALVLGTLMARLLDLIVLAVAAVVGIFFLRNVASVAFDAHLPTALLAWAIALLAVVGIGAALLASRWSKRLRRIVSQVRGAWCAVRRRPDALLWALVAAIFQHMSLFGLAVMLGAALGLDLPLAVWLFAWTSAKIAAFLPLGQAGIGTRDAAFAAAVAPFGAEPSLAVAASLAWQTVLVSACLVAGALGLLLWARRPVAVSLPREAEPRSFLTTCLCALDRSPWRRGSARAHLPVSKEAWVTGRSGRTQPR